MIEPQKRALGICVGASTISSVEICEKNGKITISRSIVEAHNGNPKKIVADLLFDKSYDYIAATGRKFRTFLNIPSISEPEAIEYAVENLNIDVDLVISAGGENFIIYKLDKNKKIAKALTGNKCASGTGEFFLQQIKRMNLELNEAIELGTKGEPYNISGRCSVFCKSDCTHALNKGVSKENVAAGLSRMTAQKIIELTAKTPYKKALLIGGVSKNTAVIKYLRNKFPLMEIPEEAPYFEAFGAAIYSLKNKTINTKKNKIFKDGKSSFSYFDDLNKHIDKVSFKSFSKGSVRRNDVCIIGLDVGSTTTKAVVLRVEDNTILASEYLRTNGDPITASIECYKSLKKQIKDPIKIIGLGTTGSGRHIAGLHALTQGVINEIIAHAAATVYFDKEADTIFEIGGQDAKYTYITAGVPSDYAMNEACSAGTGSFLEEAANESLGINFKDIGEIAFKAKNPPNFNDQCAAFISSDIKNALHEGLSKEDITAGLVYSICLNYSNRVKGNRPVGKKIFMQGGVCYNKAVPVAMAALTGKEIIVPPEPGLMGAFGAALEVKKRIELGLTEKTDFSLDELIDRKVEYGKPFICAGGSEKCDRKCSVAVIIINGKKYPFGGACNKYYNFKNSNKAISKEKNLAAVRQKLVFEKYIHRENIPESAPTIGILKSFFTNTFYPLFYNFFTQLGFRVVLGDIPKQEGIDKRESAFCYPVELAHGFMQDLIDKKPDYIFIPHILEIFNPNEDYYNKTCVLVQAEAYYLKTTFKKELENIKLLCPVINFSKGYNSAKKTFMKIASELNADKATASASFDFAAGELKAMLAEFKEIGKKALLELQNNPDDFALVLFGRAYNSFAQEANLGIPQKFSSRNTLIIPHDFLPSENYQSGKNMYWGLGKQILRSARFVKENNQLYGVFITNFSCGPDSFLITYFRDIMGSKPSLTLELDSHSADAGINTRIEAALDIIKSNRELRKRGEIFDGKNNFKPINFIDSGRFCDSKGKIHAIKDKNVKMIIPSMGTYATEAFSAALRRIGINSQPLPLYDYNSLMYGRGASSCKECLPLILTAGSMLNYYYNLKPEGEKTIFFMPESAGPCRLGQYNVFLQELIKKRMLKDIGVYTLTDEDSYQGLGNDFVLKGWTAIVIGDVLQDIHKAILAIAEDKEKSLKVLNEQWQIVLSIIEKGNFKDIIKQLETLALELKKQKKKKDIKDAVKVALVGEIFVRTDEYSRIDLIERLAQREIIVKAAPIGEYVYYSNYLVKKNINNDRLNLKQRIKFIIRDYVQLYVERKIKKVLSNSGFTEYGLIKVNEAIKRAVHLINPSLAGESILTVGSGLLEILDHTSGVISLGPFGCMPSRVAESILNVEMNREGKAIAENVSPSIFSQDINSLPFLAIETDGNIFPQIIQSKIEIFSLQAERLHKIIQNGGSKVGKNYIVGFVKKLNELYNSKIRENEFPEEEIGGIAEEV